MQTLLLLCFQLNLLSKTSSISKLVLKYTIVSVLTFHVELACAESFAELVPGNAAVFASVLQVDLSDGERAAIALEQQLEVLGLLHGLIVVEPDHLGNKN